MSYTQVPPQSTGNKIDTVTLTEGSDTVHRQVIVMGDPINPALLAGVNDLGRLKVSSEASIQNVVMGSISASGQTVAIDISRSANITAVVTGTFVGLNVAFEGSVDSTDGVNGSWVATQFARTNSSTVEVVSGALAAAPAYGWKASINGFNWIRIRATALTSGTANININPSSYPTDPAPVTQAHSLTAGTAIIGVVNPAPATAAGSYTTTRKINSVTGVNSTLVKSTAGNIGQLSCSNTSAAWRFVKLYNLATAPVVGTSIPIMTIGVPPMGYREVNIPSMGLRMSAGIGIGMTLNPADNDTAGAVADELIVNIAYV